MSEMIERVAKAIMSEESPDSLDQYSAMARAAIEAMREPSRAMVEAMSKTVGENRDPAPTAAAWYAMIDVALSRCP